MVILKESPVYLLAGTEQFLKEEHLARIKSTFLDKEFGDFNFNVFYPARPLPRGRVYPGPASAEKILECARTAPFLGRKRLVLVRQLESFSVSDKKLILSYVRARPSRHTALVLETSEVNLNQGPFAEICKYAQVIFCQPLKGNQLFAWIKAQVKVRDKRIEEKAKGILVDNLGNDLKLLSSALDNLILYIGEKQTIEVSDVEKLVGSDLATSAFELFDAIVLRNKRKVLQILDSLFKDGVNSSQILGALAYRMISEKDRIDTSVFERSFEDLQKTDSDIKTGRQSQKIALELLMVRLLNLF